MTRIFLLGRVCQWISACSWKLHLRWDNHSTVEAMFLHGDQILKMRRAGKSMRRAGKSMRRAGKKLMVALQILLFI